MSKLKHIEPNIYLSKAMLFSNLDILIKISSGQEILTTTKELREGNVKTLDGKTITVSFLEDDDSI